jgi:hypothetical protein
LFGFQHPETTSSSIPTTLRTAPTARATLFGGTEDADLLRRYRDTGPPRVVVTLLQETANKTLPVLDRRVDLIRRVNV